VYQLKVLFTLIVLKTKKNLVVFLENVFLQQVAFTNKKRVFLLVFVFVWAVCSKSCKHGSKEGKVAKTYLF